ncbi:MAG: FlgD immunoglobulin-like domain containing protein, partial [bacterium]
TVTLANRSPEVTHPIPDTTLVLSGLAFEMDLHDFFFDPDGDDVEFSATSSNEDVVQAAVEGSKLSLMTISVGISDITVRARDATHPEVSDTFRVTVTLANRSPEVTHPIPDTTLSLGGPVAEFDLAAVFQDPEADELVFGATSVDTNIVAVALSGVILQTMPQAPGRSTVTVTASDKINPEVALTFTVTVTTNQPPAVRNPISHTTLVVDGPDFVTDLLDVFSDPEQDDLTFTASSSNESIASPQVTGSILTVSPVSPGDVTVHLTASDNVNPAVDHIFAVTVERLNRPPVLEQPVADAMIFIGGHNFQLDLDVVFSDPDEETLSYQAVSTDETVAFATVSDPMLTVIPLSEGSAVVKVRATDPKGGTDSTAFSVEVAQYPGIFHVSTSVSYARREGAKAFDSQEYRMWGLPGADNRLIDALFSGEQDDAWQVFWDNGKPRDYFVAFDGSDNFRLAAGRAFWVINNGPWHINLDASSAPLTAANEVEIPLHPGFNLITSPFDTTVEWLRVQAVNGVSEPIWSFDGVFNQATELVPNTGYYFFNREDLAVLRIPYRLTFASAQSVAAGADTTWRGKISLSSGKTQRETIVFGVARDARPGLDPLDHFKPRAISAGSRLYFDRADWHSDHSEFASDIRPEIVDLESWPFRLQAAKGVRGTLAFSGLQRVAPEYDIYLVEMETGRAEDLRTTSSYGFTARADISTFKIVVGKRKHVQDVLRAVVPTRFIVESNYPNPFNPTTTIPVSVPQRAQLTLQVYNLLGQKVKTLYTGVIEPGRLLFTWDGRDQSGTRVASGVYIYRVRFASGKMFQGKMLMVK